MKKHTCKDCFYHGICGKLIWQEKDGSVICEDFKDPSHILELPCAIGDTVYLVCEEYTCDSYKCVWEHTQSCEECECNKHKFYIKEKKFSLADYCLFGKKVFLTKEAAERVLEEIKGEKT